MQVLRIAALADGAGPAELKIQVGHVKGKNLLSAGSGLMPATRTSTDMLINETDRSRRPSPLVSQCHVIDAGNARAGLQLRLPP